jgi:2-polyprenyl-3-methyl-5-hydroxy-6-metoxy-1,4-benzoquinol methylase
MRSPGLEPDGYEYADAETTEAHEYLHPALVELLKNEKMAHGRRIFELGCGNGSTAAFLMRSGFDVVGVDPSKQGIAKAKQAYPALKLELGSCYEPLASRFGQFPIVISLEVIEHVYLPRAFAKTVHDLLEPGGIAIISTPFHGYWKNLALALTGKLDEHFTALWDYGHIKFWSQKTLDMLLSEAKLEVIEFRRVGRIQPLAKSMIALARRR